MGTTREIHITSSTIRKTRGRIDRELKDDMVGFVRGMIPAADVQGSGFGTFGDQIIGGTYKDVQVRCDEIMGEAMATLESWVTAMTHCERNWTAAENANMVGYRA
ncbi:hypothetical protein [Nonomuraea rubra]|uniref:WXG100 family type VII secretion target n=1 Tax=Nonomuraea rubra TaxID=46180 RepID=A0A7X0U5F9_9ACTN|nr:hypothetical protein [Nonomuraea rubra]MBB6555495.1 hypothetical protein [Nonomuraea rubra]